MVSTAALLAAPETRISFTKLYISLQSLGGRTTVSPSSFLICRAGLRVFRSFLGEGESLMVSSISSLTVTVFFGVRCGSRFMGTFCMFGVSRWRFRVGEMASSMSRTSSEEERLMFGDALCANCERVDLVVRRVVEEEDEVMIIFDVSWEMREVRIAGLWARGRGVRKSRSNE